MLDPPANFETVFTMMDGDVKTCVALAGVAHYTVPSRWVARPSDRCWTPGLLIKMLVPDTTKTSFTVTITGNRLTCSTSHFTVAMREKKWSACDHEGLFRKCQWKDAVKKGGLTTCVAECQCEGNDCKHVTVHIPSVYEQWKICEIEIK